MESRNPGSHRYTSRITRTAANRQAAALLKDGRAPVILDSPSCNHTAPRPMSGPSQSLEREVRSRHLWRENAAGERWSRRNTGVSDGVWMKARRRMTMDDVQHGGVARHWFKLLVGISAGTAAMFLIGASPVHAQGPPGPPHGPPTTTTEPPTTDHRAADHDHRAAHHDHRAADHDHRAADDHRRADNDPPAGDDRCTHDHRPAGNHCRADDHRRAQDHNVDGSHAVAAGAPPTPPTAGDAVSPSGESDVNVAAPTVQSRGPVPPNADLLDQSAVAAPGSTSPTSAGTSDLATTRVRDPADPVRRNANPVRVVDDTNSVTWAALEARITQSPLALGIQFKTRTPSPLRRHPGPHQGLANGSDNGGRRSLLLGVPIALGFGGAGWWLLLARRTAPAGPAAPTSATVRVTRRKL